MKKNYTWDDERGALIVSTAAERALPLADAEAMRRELVATRDRLLDRLADLDAELAALDAAIGEVGAPAKAAAGGGLNAVPGADGDMVSGWSAPAADGFGNRAPGE